MPSVDCFCGCGRKVGYRLRAVNKRGAELNRDAMVVHALLQRGLRSPAAERFLAEATAHVETMATAVHTGRKLKSDADVETASYAKFAEARFSDPALRSSVRTAKKSPEEAAAELSAGTWDPFADVVFPDGNEALAAPAHPPTWQSVREGSTEP